MLPLMPFILPVIRFVSIHISVRSVGFPKFSVLTQKASVARLTCMSTKTARIGRPPKTKKQVNPVRQIGRWPDSDWDLIRTAAKNAGKNIAQWAREKLLRAARRSEK